MSAQTAFATRYLHSLKCCNPIGQFHRLPVACVGFVFFLNKVDVDLLLDVEAIPGKFHRNRLYGVETHSEQTDRQTDRQTFFFIYIDVNNPSFQASSYDGSSVFFMTIY